MFGKYKKLLASGRPWAIHAAAGIFSICMLLGVSYSRVGSWDMIFGSGRRLALSVFVFIICFIVFDVLICIFYNWLKRKDFTAGTVRWKYPDVIGRHYMAFAFGVIFVCWLPWLIVYYPGSVPHDGYVELNMFFGIEPLTNHHPWVLTMCMGSLFSIGRVVSDSFGIFLIVLIFSLLEAFCYAVVCSKIRKWKVFDTANVIILLFYGVVPVFGTYAQAVIKDGMFTALFSLFMILYIECCIYFATKQEEEVTWHLWLALFVTGLSVCLTRNNGIYMIVPAILLLIFLTVKSKKKYVFLLLLALVFSYYAVENKLADAVGVEPGSKKEMLSIPFQQTARYLKEYPDDAAPEERAAINKVLNEPVLADNYNPEISDPVKNTYRSSADGDDLKAYLKVWVSMLKKHPSVYMQATIHNTFGYYYPFSNRNVLSAYQFYIKGEPVATGAFDFQYANTKEIRDLFSDYADMWRKLPILSLIMNPGTYTWILILFCGFLFYQKRGWGSLVLAAPFLNTAVCIASPVNGLLRYAMPLAACLPCIIFWCIFYGKFCGRQPLIQWDFDKEGDKNG